MSTDKEFIKAIRKLTETNDLILYTQQFEMISEFVNPLLPDKSKQEVVDTVIFQTIMNVADAIRSLAYVQAKGSYNVIDRIAQIVSELDGFGSSFTNSITYRILFAFVKCIKLGDECPEVAELNRLPKRPEFDNTDEVIEALLKNKITEGQPEIVERFKSTFPDIFELIKDIAVNSKNLSSEELQVKLKDLIDKTFKRYTDRS